MPLKAPAGKTGCTVQSNGEDDKIWPALLVQVRTGSFGRPGTSSVTGSFYSVITCKDGKSAVPTNAPGARVKKKLGKAGSRSAPAAAPHSLHLHLLKSSASIRAAGRRPWRASRRRWAIKGVAAAPELRQDPPSRGDSFGFARAQRRAGSAPSTLPGSQVGGSAAASKEGTAAAAARRRALTSTAEAGGAAAAADRSRERLENKQVSPAGR